MNKITVLEGRGEGVKGRWGSNQQCLLHKNTRKKPTISLELEYSITFEYSPIGIESYFSNLGNKTKWIHYIPPRTLVLSLSSSSPVITQLLALQCPIADLLLPSQYFHPLFRGVSKYCKVFMWLNPVLLSG